MQETERLLEKLRKGSCSAEELRALRVLLKTNDALSEWLDQDLERTQHTPDEAQSAALWNKIAAVIKAGEPKVVSLQPGIRIRKLVYRWAGAAAVLLLAFFVWQYMKPPSPTAILVIESATSGEIQEERLPDGSTVWLNRNSKITYQKRPNDSLRLVVLEGEAFFEVATDSLQPFVVMAGDVQTKVLGTAFNVQAFAGSHQVKVALQTGKVQVLASNSNAILSPGELLIFNKQEQTTTTRPYFQDAPYAWRNGIISFDGADVREVAAVLENWYGIQFVLEDMTRMNSELVTRLDATRMTMEQVLEVIAKVTDYRFERKSRKAILVKPD